MIRIPCNVRLPLMERFYPNDPSWKIQEASILDAKLPERLGQFDLVYSWGVLHHTGRMWDAIDNASRFVKPNGLFVLAMRYSISCGLAAFSWLSCAQWAAA